VPRRATGQAGGPPRRGEPAAKDEGPEREPWLFDDLPHSARGILNAILHHPRSGYTDHSTVLVNSIDVHKRAEHQMAAFAERGWPAGRIPTTREIVLSMIERSA